MAYKEQDFKGCIINPLQKNLLEANPRLQELVPVFDLQDEDTEEPALLITFEKSEIENIFRYIIALYDPASPLYKNERDLVSRKQQAADLAGLPNDTDYLQTVFECSHKLIVPLASQYLQKFAKSMEYAAMVVIENCFWESVTKLMEPITPGSSKAELEAVQKKSAIKDELDKDIDRLKKYWKAFFGDDSELETKVKKRMTPENVTKNL